MPHAAIYEWEGREYAFEEKGADWYWALGILATAGVIVCILLSNILLALVLAAGAVAIALAALRRPRIHRFSVYEDGLAIDNHFYRFEDMLSFSVLEYADETLPPSLSLKTKHPLAPHLVIPIVGHDPVEIYEHFTAILPEGRHDESVTDRFIELFRL